MKIVTAIVCAAVLSLPGVASAGEAYGCDAVNFSKDVLDRMPNAQKLCRGVTERNGGIYVKYVAEVVDTSDKTVTVVFKDKDEKPVTRVEFEPAKETVKYGGKDYDLAHIKKGAILDFYISRDRWGLYASPQGQAMKIVKSEPVMP